MRYRLGRLGVVFVVAGAVCLPPLAADAVSAALACSHGYATRREVAQGRFFDRRWELALFRDRRGRACLTDSWGRYGSIFRFRVRDHRPRLGMLNLNATSPPRGRSAYVFEGYVAERVAAMTFRIDGRTRSVRIVRSPRWTRLPKDLFVHFVGARRYDHDATGRLRAFDSHGKLLAARVLRRRQFFGRGEID